MKHSSHRKAVEESSADTLADRLEEYAEHARRSGGEFVRLRIADVLRMVGAARRGIERGGRTTSATEIMHRRFYEGRPERIAQREAVAREMREEVGT